MFAHYRTEGFFLNKKDIGETDQFFSVFTKNYGKIKLLGRAIRKIKSKLRSGADIFFLSDIEFIQGKTRKTLTDAILIEKFKNLRSEPEKISLAYQIISLAEIFLPVEEKDIKIWNLIIKTFSYLNDLRFTICDLPRLYFFFFWNLTSFLGYSPELYFCAICQKKLIPSNAFWFSLKEGGVVCPLCLAEVPQGEKKFLKKVNINAIKILRIIFREDFGILAKLKIEKEDEQNLEEITDFYAAFLKKEFSKKEI